MLLTLTIWDADTGTKLKEYERPMWSREQGEDLIEKCRLMGVARAHKWVEWYRLNGKDNAFANVDCEWHKGSPA